MGEERVDSADSAGLGSLCHEQLDNKNVTMNESSRLFESANSIYL